MSAKRTAVLVMAKMALADGQVRPEERALLGPFLGEGESLEELLAEVQDLSLESLLGEVDLYADRFFIALRAASLAQVDGEVALQEQALYQSLLGKLQLRAEDEELIERSLRDTHSIEPIPPDPRIEDLFEQSSFCR